jgi:pescadillo protein
MGNRVKGRVKKKSIKAASFSAMGSKRKLSRMGKKQKKDHAGLDATFIGRSACLKKLQITLKDFRRLCILKGIYPREPRGRTPSNKKGQVYYHIKDVKALSHEPLLQKFRDFRAFMKKVRNAAGRNEKDEAARKESLAPTYTLHHLVRERYPRFVDALSDLDDALALVYLFAALPSTGRVASKITRKAQMLASQWSAYCATTSSITKSFVSVKGVYMEAMILNCPIRWVIPHSFTQHMPQDVDFRVMTTFFEFYETLLGFVLYKLFNDLGVRYPLPLADVEVTSSSTMLAANLNIMEKVLKSNGGHGSASTAVNEAVKISNTENEITSGSKKTENNQANKRKQQQLLKSVDTVLNQIGSDDTDEDTDDEEENADISAPLKAALESINDEDGSSIFGSKNLNLDEDAKKRRHLFSGLTFFLSREIPKGYLELVCLAYGGKIGWDGNDSPISIKDPSITHHITDRPKLPTSYDSLPKSREYVQPQWILDCANFQFLLPCSKYGINVTLPPHLSPWVDNEEEGYKPAYAEEIDALKNGIVHGDTKTIQEYTQEAEGSESESETESETTGNQVEFEATQDDQNTSEDSMEEDDLSDENTEEEEEEEEEDEEDHDIKASKRTEKDNEEAKVLAKTMMSKKAARLYGRMQHGLAQKQAKIDELNRKREAIVTKNGKTPDGRSRLKAKVDRLKLERKTIEKDYNNTGGSMKKRKTKK